MKNKHILLSILVAASLLIGTTTVNASTNATAIITSHSKQALMQNGSDGWKPCHNTIFSVTMDGKSYEGYCMDPDYKFKTAEDSNVTCDETNIAAYKYMFQHRSSVDTFVFQLAERLVSQKLGTASVAKLGGVAYYNLAQNLDQDYTQYFKGDDASIQAAIAFAKEALAADESSSSSESVETSIKFKKRSGSDSSCGTVTYDVTSAAEIQNVQFTCEENCTIVDSSFEGKKGTVTVQPAKISTCSEAKLKIGMTWDGSTASDKVYICHGSSSQIQHLLVGNSTSGGTDYEDDIPTGCKSGGDCCCKPEEDLSKPKETDINNCCTADTESNLREYDLNDLFCYDNTVKVNYYLDKCDNARYNVTSSTTGLNQYCDMYCTERVKINTPSSITAVSGRYFSLTSQTIDGFTTTAPYLREVRRCRIKVKYNEWDKAYKEAIVSEIDEFNTFQENRAEYELYNSATESTMTGTISIRATCTEEDEDGHEHTFTCNTGSYDYSYKKYKFAKTKQTYGTTKFDTASYNAHTKFKAETDKLLTATHPVYSVFERSDAVAGLEAEKSNVEGGCSCDGSTDVHSKEIPDGDKLEEDVITKTAEYKEKYEVASDKYNADLDTAYNLEQYLLKCNAYYNNIDPEDGYDTSLVSLKFTYDQIYRDESGYTELDEIPVDFTGAFSGKACKVEKFDYSTFTENSNDIFADQYSSEYGSKYAQGIGMKNKGETVTYGTDGSVTRSSGHVDLELAKTLSEANSYVRQENSGLKADKRFSYDFVFKATCGWLEEENVIYTLVPGGLAATSQITKNFVVNKQKYSIYLTTYEGNYETNWDLEGIGHKGRLDKWFKDTKTCTEEYAHTNHTTGQVTFSCYVKVTNKLVKTGKCNTPASAAYLPDDCDSLCTGPNCSLDYNFQYKTVDTSDLFISTTTSDGNEYATNWTGTTTGQKAMADIEKSGTEDTTYNPENKTYSFTLTTAKAKEIKEYNEKQNEEGGYEDFELTCSCASNGGSTECTQCKSSFLENNVTKENLNSARSKVHWKSE